MMIPGRMLHRVATHVCSAKTIERVVEPAIADLQKEWASSSTADPLRRVWILLAGYCAIVKVIAICALNATSPSGDERRVLVRTLGWSVAMMIAVTGLLMLPPLALVEGGLSAISLAGLIPQALPLAIPIGLTFGIAFGMAGRQFFPTTKRVVLLFALAASLVSFATLAWVMPVANQAYRESVAHAAGVSGPLIKGASEMSLSELDREATIAATAGNASRADHYAWSFHLRFALSTASMVLAAFLFATGGSGAALRGLLAFAACFVYWVLIFVGEGLAVYSPIAPVFAGTIPVFAGAWLPNIVFAASTILIASSRSSRLRGQRGVAR
jgi:hypothetical protein